MVVLPSANSYAYKRTDGRKERNINNSKSGKFILGPDVMGTVVISNISIFLLF